jgi:hypothetical protein
MPKSSKPPLSTLEMWMQQNPDEHQRSPYNRFLQIPAHITQSIQKSPVVKGAEAQAVWKTVANHLKNRHDPQSVQYFARNGMFTNIAALCEDRLSSLFVHRSQQMYGHFYVEQHSDVPRKANFLYETDDIDSDTHAALRQYPIYRNPVMHQAHYHTMLMCDEVIDAYNELLEVLTRLRNRQRSVLKKESSTFPVDNQQAVVGFWNTLQSEAWYDRAFIHAYVGGGMLDTIPFRHGVPLYVVVTSPQAQRVTKSLKQVPNEKTWQNIVNASHLQRQWQIPVFWGQSSQVQLLRWATPMMTMGTKNSIDIVLL